VAVVDVDLGIISARATRRDEQGAGGAADGRGGERVGGVVEADVEEAR